MANNYSTVKEDLSNRKFFAIKIQSARNVTSLVSLESGNTYSYNSDFISCTKLTVDGTEYTKTSSSTPSSSEFYFNFVTKELKVNLGAALTTQIIIAFHDLFYTNDQGYEFYENPKLQTGNVVTWEPRITNSPSVRYSQSNVLNGFLTIKSDSVTIENSEKDLNIYFTNNDSFYLKEVKIFHCLNNFENIRHLYTGFVSAISKGNNDILLRIDDVLSNLNNTFWSGTGASNSYINSATYASNTESDFNVPIRKQYGRVNFTRQISRTIAFNDPVVGAGNIPATTGLSNGSYFTRVVRDGFQGICTDSGAGTSANRNWNTAFKPRATGDYSATITAVTSVGGATYDIEGPDITKVIPCDNGAINSTNPINTHFVVEEVYSTGKIRINMSPSNSSGGFTWYTPLVNDTFYRFEVSQAYLIDSIKIDTNGKNYIYPLVQNAMFTLSTDGNGQRVITLANNFEGTYFGASGVGGGPNANTAIGQDSNLYFVRWETGSVNHSDLLKEVIEDAGFSVDTTSFTAAASIDFDVNFTNPTIDQTEFTTYLSIIQKILSSSNGILKYDYENEEFFYYILSSAVGTETIDDNTIIRDSLTHEIDYADIVTDLLFYNGHNPEIDAVDATAISFRERSLLNVVDNTAKYLHTIDREKTLDVLLDGQNFSTATDEIQDLYFTPKKYSTFTIKNDFEKEIDDDFTLSSNYNLNNNDRDLKVLETNINSSQIQVKAIEI